MRCLFVVSCERQRYDHHHEKGKSHGRPGARWNEANPALLRMSRQTNERTELDAAAPLVIINPDQSYLLHLETPPVTERPLCKVFSFEGGASIYAVHTSAETTLTLKNSELIHFGFFRRGFVEKESIHDTQIY